jgi:hypothetical protein
MCGATVCGGRAQREAMRESRGRRPTEEGNDVVGEGDAGG